MVRMKGTLVLLMVSHLSGVLFSCTEWEGEIKKTGKKNYNPFGLKNTLRSANVYFGGQETNFQVTGVELTLHIRKCYGGLAPDARKVLSGKDRGRKKCN